MLYVEIFEAKVLFGNGYYVLIVDSLLEGLNVIPLEVSSLKGQKGFKRETRPPNR